MKAVAVVPGTVGHLRETHKFKVNTQLKPGG